MNLDYAKKNSLAFRLLFILSTLLNLLHLLYYQFFSLLFTRRQSLYRWFSVDQRNFIKLIIFGIFQALQSSSFKILIVHMIPLKNLLFSKCTFQGFLVFVILYIVIIYLSHFFETDQINFL